MADTATEPLPNGNAVLSAEEEDERLKQRPADIDADVREMERRKRVEALMSSKLFREELERVLDQQMHEGGDAPLLQRIREMVGGRLHTGTFRSPSCVLPINDIRGIEGFGYEKGEKILRCKLAACYRLVDLFGWTQTGINGQITARLNTAVEQVLTTPRGLLPHEVTASSLVKVDMQGVVQDQGTTNFPINVEGFSLHASVHAARPDLRCVLHVRSPGALAVSSTKRGLLPLTHEAALLGQVAYHRAPHGLLDNEEHEKLVRALGPSAKVLMLSGSGALCCGASLEEAFHQARQLTVACEVQLRLAAVPQDDLQLLDEETRRQIYEQSRAPPAGDAKWRVGGEEFEALMRMLDNAGFRTGYIYRHPLIKNEVPRPKNDVECPPAVSSLGYLLEEEELYRQGIWKKGTGKAGERTRWLNSPNVYQKVEVLETGTNDPKKITKWVDANNEEWVQDGSPAHSSTPVKIDTLQFVPKNTNPKEFKALQQQIKDNRRADKISAGPQSHILEGVTWDEASKLVGEDAVNTHTGDHVVLMGAASKGIIQRGHQHNATMYSAPYARNPFEHVTDSDIDEYRRLVERRARPDYDTDLSESEAISAAQITSPASATETEEESRDEHRVLRIETKQVPVRSQPEVVLSDVDTTDFLHAERSHADRTRGSIPKEPERDPNLLSDDEVFLDSPAASTASSAVTSPAPPPAPVTLVRVQAGVVRGTKLTTEANEALSTNKRSLHDYSRNSNVEKIIQKYDDDNKHPKCKVSLNDRLGNEVRANVDKANDGIIKFQEFDGFKIGTALEVDAVKLDEVINKDEPLDLDKKNNQGELSSRSSLYSIPSIEWDGRCKLDYTLRTQSLPRRSNKSTSNLFRTRSYSGFANSYIRDPEPTHFHIPKCRSCGSNTNSYVWELNKERKNRKSHSVYFSVDNIHQECLKEEMPDIVKVKEKLVPVFKVAEVQDEFVESQEFNEDNYLTDLNSFSSENQTVIEKPDKNDVTVTEINLVEDSVQIQENTDDLYKAEMVQILDRDNPDTNEGEYHSFSDDMDFEDVYESPVKDLVEKDIRDYSVPINFYCEDYAKKDSPKKSPKKLIAVIKDNLILEPILEESKSSYDESNSSNNESKNINRDSDIESGSRDPTDVSIEISSPRVAETLNKDIETDYQIHTLQKNAEVSSNGTEIVEIELHENIDVYNKETTDKNLNSVQVEDVIIAEDEMAAHASTQKDEYIVMMSDATNQHDESIFKIPTVVPQRDLKVAKNYEAKPRRSDDYSIASSTDMVSFNSTVEFEKYEVITDILVNILNRIDFTDNDDLGERHDLVKESNVLHFDYQGSANGNKSDVTDQSDSGQGESFSITKIIQEIEGTTNLNDTVSTVISEVDSQPYKIAEAIVYYVFDRACSYWENKERSKASVVKTVVTVVDCEDILYTAASLWVEAIDLNKELRKDYNDPECVKVLREDTMEIPQNSSIGAHSYVNDNFDKSNIGADVINELLDQLVTEPEMIPTQEYGVKKEEILNTGTNSNKTLSLNDFNDDLDAVEAHAVNSETNAVENLFQYLDEEADPENHEKMGMQLCYDSTSNVDNNDINLQENIQDDLPTRQAGNELQQENENTYEGSIYDNLNNNIVNDHEISIQVVPGNEVHNVTDSEQELPNFNINTSDNNIPTEDVETNDESHDITDREKDTSLDNLNKTIDIDTDVLGEMHDDDKSYDIDTETCDVDSELVHEMHDDDISQIIDVPKNDNVHLNETFVIVPEECCSATLANDMNTAFVQDDYYNSRSSSPNVHKTNFEACTESPIINTNNSDLSALYEKDDSIYGSPFIKRASVISMSQTEHKGGVKYWLSFDDSLTDIERHEKINRPVRKFTENKMPSFFAVDLDNELHDSYDSSFRRSSVLLDSYSKEGSNIGIEESFMSAKALNSDNYDTCDSDLIENMPQKMLLYNSRNEMRRTVKRLYSTWPPFEDTLFYRIISKFRMSESFDPSDLENMEKLDATL